MCRSSHFQAGDAVDYVQSSTHLQTQTGWPGQSSECGSANPDCPPAALKLLPSTRVVRVWAPAEPSYCDVQAMICKMLKYTLHSRGCQRTSLLLKLLTTEGDLVWDLLVKHQQPSKAACREALLLCGRQSAHPEAMCSSCQAPHLNICIVCIFRVGLPALLRIIHSS